MLQQRYRNPKISVLQGLKGLLMTHPTILRRGQWREELPSTFAGLVVFLRLSLHPGLLLGAIHAASLQNLVLRGHSLAFQGGDRLGLVVVNVENSQ